MITFIYNGIDINLNESNTILQLKENIINTLNLKSKYIDINILIERPIRKLGKFTLESGVLPRGYDIYPLNKYGLDGNKIKIDIIEINNYVPFVKKKVNTEINKVTSPVSFNLSSSEEFPKLS